jgi:hypothetical protein
VQISYTCNQCHQGATLPLHDATGELVCPSCSAVVAVPEGAIEFQSVHRCVVCPSTELYVRKDFNQQLGVGIVAVGIVLSTIAWYYRQIYLTYGIFFGTALLDFVLWLVMGNLLQCYRCQAQYRGMIGMEEHGGFDLETHEKHRQTAARLAAAQPAAKHVTS